MRTNHLISKDIVSAVEQFKRRFEAFWNEVIMGKSDGGKGPLGVVDHYFWRLEYQARGAPHVHALLWIKDAPVLKEDHSNEEEVREFIDQHITCHLPDESDVENAALRKKVLDYQLHRCGQSCKRAKYVKTSQGGRHISFCRFGFPRKMSETTKISSVERSVKSRGTGKGEKYYHVERTYDERQVNDYNPAILLGWDANVDIQYVAEDSFVVVNYITKYVTKCEGNSTQELWEGIGNQKGKSIQSKLYQLGARALKNREMGAYEAAFWLLGFPLTGTKRGDAIKYVSTLPKEFRRRRVKSKKDIENLPEGSTDLCCNNLVDTFYPNRPKTEEFEKMCLFDMAANWEHSYKKPAGKIKEAEDEVDLENSGNCNEPDPESTPGEVVSFANGFLKKRRAPHVIKTNYCSVKSHDFEERLFHSILMLFKPWRQESELLGPYESYAEAYVAYEEELQASAQRWLFGRNKLQKAEELRKQWEEEQMDVEEDSGIQPQEDPSDGDSEENILPSVELNAETVSRQLGQLNADQTAVYESVMACMHHQHSHDPQRCHCAADKKLPIRQIVSGVAGTGKSFLIKAICDALNLEYGATRNPNGENGNSSSLKPVVAVLAPTGLAAYNVGGVTCHRYFKLPVQHGTEIQYQQLNFDSLKKMRNTMKDVKLIIVDEFSMISNTMLNAINMTLNAVFGVAAEHEDLEGKSPQEISFGGKNLVLFGDLLQLPPVLSRFCFQELTRAQRKRMTGIPLKTFNLLSQFSYSELETNMRQKDDLIYSTLLNKFRLGNMAEEDIQKVSSRVIPELANCDPAKLLDKSSEYFQKLLLENKDTLALFSKTENVEKFNQKMLERLEIDTIDIEAEDCNTGTSGLRKKLKKKGKLRTAARKLKTSDTAGLEQTLRIGKTARVMLRRNLDPDAGLVNGAIGSVVEISKNRNGRVQKVLVDFGKLDNGRFQSNIHEIEPFSAQYNHQGVTVTRRQFPLSLAYAITIHKSQGLTLHSVLLDLNQKDIFADAMGYVALSRVRSLENVHLINFDLAAINCCTDAANEYRRLRESAGYNCDDFCFNKRPEQYVRKVPSIRPSTWSNLKGKISADIASSSIDQVAPPVTRFSPFLKLQWNRNNCYGNSIIQALLGLPELENQLHPDGRATTCIQICDALRSLFVRQRQHTERGLVQKDAISTVRFCQYALQNSQQQFGRMQDAEEFWRELCAQFPMEVRDCFTFRRIVENVCHNCNRNERNAAEWDCVLSLPISANNPSFRANFRDLQQQLRNPSEPIENFVCPICQNSETTFQQYSISFKNEQDEDTKFLFVQLGLTNIFNVEDEHGQIKQETVRLNRGIANFDAKKTNLFGVNFKAVAALLHIGGTHISMYEQIHIFLVSCIGTTFTFLLACFDVFLAHYSCWRRDSENSWYSLSDDKEPEKRSKFRYLLKDVYLLLLERID